MAALAARGGRVAAAKVGPDFIDPGYHALATGRPGRNLDAWLSGRDAIGAPGRPGGGGADVLVVEGVMGLFDGASDGTPSSTADVAAPARRTRRPRRRRRRHEPVGRGRRARLRHLRRGAGGVAGVILNRVGSDGHETLLRDALAPLGLPVLGALRRDDALTWRDRHLGLVPVAERPAVVRAALDRLAAVIARQCDLDAVVGLAAWRRLTVADPPRPGGRGPAAPGPRRRPGLHLHLPRQRGGAEAAGAEIVPFDPLPAAALPPASTGSWWAAASPRCTARRWPPTSRCSPTCAAGSAAACRRGPSAAASCGWPARWTVGPWRG